jgi:hypothetical protein
MKKLIVIGVLFGALFAFTDEAAAQPRGEMIAYDDCLPDFWGIGDGWVVCDMFLMSEGVPITHIGDGADGAWSPDGSRLAIGGNREPGIFVLNSATGHARRFPAAAGRRRGRRMEPDWGSRAASST